MMFSLKEVSEPRFKYEQIKAKIDENKSKIVPEQSRKLSVQDDGKVAIKYVNESRG